MLSSRSVVSNSLCPHELQHTQPPCPSPSPWVCSKLCPLSQWHHPNISSCVAPFSSCPQSFCIRVFCNESALHIRGPKYWNFSLSISPSSEYPGLISFRVDWFDLASMSFLSFFFSTTVWKHRFFSTQPSYGLTLAFVHDYWESHSFENMDLCQQSDVSAF